MGVNERIKEFAEQAGFMDYWFSESGDDCERELKKFAELIVQECCDIFVELRTRPADLAAVDVKNHFGVK